MQHNTSVRRIGARGVARPGEAENGSDRLAAAVLELTNCSIALSVTRLKGGAEVASRVRTATATCVVVFGLLLGGAGGALAFAEPVDGGGEGVRSDPDVTAGERPGDGRDAGDRDDDDDGADDHPATRTATATATAVPTRKPTETRTPEPTDTETPEPTETEQPPRCEDRGDHDCGLGGWWPWWPWPTPGPRPPGDAPGSGGGGGGSIEPPSGRPDLPPQMQLPPELRPPSEPAGPAEPVSVVPGVGLPAGVPQAPITLPVIVAPSIGLGGGSATGPSAPLPRAPRGVEVEPPPVRQRPPTEGLSNVARPATSYRAGYADHLRTAGTSQLVALAAPGLTGMLVLTGAGGLVGYRQAKAGHVVRAGTMARFVN